MNAGGELLEEATNDFSIFCLKASRIRFVPVTLSRYLKLRKPSVLIANMWPLTSAAVIAKILNRERLKLILVEHCLLSLQYSGKSWIFKWLMYLVIQVTHRFTDHVVGVSEGVRLDLEKIARTRRGRFSVIYNAVPGCPSSKNFFSEIGENFWGCPAGARILTVGNLKPEKNHVLLLHAFARLKRPNSRLMIVGTGTTKSNIEKVADQLGITDRVIFTGFQRDIWPFYLSADLFVLSSDYEGLGNVLVEALSTGLKVVSTNCPTGPAEVLENGRWGRLTPVGNIESLASAIEVSLMEGVDPGKNKRRARRFDPDAIALEYIELIRT
jgi:glycosyltransferase involved in cell wall biosynthesis